MGVDEKKTHSKMYPYQTNISWFKIGGTNFGSPVHGVEEGVFRVFGKFQEAPMGKDEKKTYRKFHCDQMTESWFKIGGTIG